MNDLTVFESSLEQRLQGYASSLPPTADLDEIARRAVVAGGPARPVRWPVDRRLVLLAAVLLLAAAVAAVGSMTTRRALEPHTIVFTTADGLWRAEPGGSSPRLLVAGKGFLGPQVSPDGEYILLRDFERQVEAGAGAIAVVDADGRTVGRVPIEPGAAADWVSAPAGPLIQVVDLGRVSLVSPSGVTVFSLARTPDGGEGDAWTREGAMPAGLPSIVFRDGPSRFWRYVAGQAEPTLVWQRPFDVFIQDHHVSPDGSTLAYVTTGQCRVGPCAGDLWITSVEGGQPRRLDDRVAGYTEVAWDADGESLVVTRLDGEARPEPARIHVDARVERIPLLDPPVSELLRFHPTDDPSALIVVSEEELARPQFTLWRLDRTSGELTRLVSGTSGVARWEPPSSSR